MRTQLSPNKTLVPKNGTQAPGTLEILVRIESPREQATTLLDQISKITKPRGATITVLRPQRRINLQHIRAFVDATIPSRNSNNARTARGIMSAIVRMSGVVYVECVRPGCKKRLPECKCRGNPTRQGAWDTLEIDTDSLLKLTARDILAFGISPVTSGRLQDFIRHLKDGH